MRVALVNGLVDAPISPWDRGFLYGDGAFETLRVYRGRPFALDDHLELLAATARSLAIEADEACASLRREAHQAVSLAGGGELVLRLAVSGGEGAGGPPTRVALAEPFSPLPAATYDEGVSVETRPLAGGALGPKTLSYLPHLAALQRARARGQAEVLWRDEQGGLGQGSTCNVLLVAGGRLIAPAPAGGRAGVTRRWLLRLAGLAADERPIFPGDLPGASELLLCSTLREVVPVVKIDGLAVGDGRPGPVGQGLRRALRQAAGAG